MIGLGLDGYEPDSGHESAIAFRIRVVEAGAVYSGAFPPWGS